MQARDEKAERERERKEVTAEEKEDGTNEQSQERSRKRGKKHGEKHSREAGLGLGETKRASRGPELEDGEESLRAQDRGGENETSSSQHHHP